MKINNLQPLPFTALLPLLLLTVSCSEDFENETVKITDIESGIIIAEAPDPRELANIRVELSGSTHEIGANVSTISNVKLTFTDENDEYRTYSDSEGQYSIYLPVGEYKVEVKKAGYTTRVYNQIIFWPSINISNKNYFYLDPLE